MSLGGRSMKRLLSEIETKFLQADIGVNNVDRIVTEIRERWRMGKIKNAADARLVVTEQLLANWPPQERELRVAAEGPTVILVAGINGAGKTTSIAKLAWLLKEQMGKKVMVCASDTFREGGGRSIDDLVRAIGRGDCEAQDGG